jgi:ribosomal protein L10
VVKNTFARIAADEAGRPELKYHGWSNRLHRF